MVLTEMRAAVLRSMAAPTEFDDASVIGQVRGADARDLRSALVSLLASGDIGVTRRSTLDTRGICWSRPLHLTPRGQRHLEAVAPREHTSRPSLR